MQPVQVRLARLVAFLRRAGYQFASPEEVLPGPDPHVDEQLAELTRLVGLPPAALVSFYRTIGSVNLVGTHPDWHASNYPDPLVIYPIQVALEEAAEYSTLDDPATEYWGSESGIFRAPVSPDALHKANVSGGMWYGIEIPNPLDDPLVLEAPQSLRFTEYLDFALDWGGFPGLSTAPSHTYPLAQLREAAAV